MRLRRVESESQIAAADDLSRLYSQEIQSLEAKIISQKRQIDLAQEELDAVNSLASKGLSNNARQFSLDRGIGGCPRQHARSGNCSDQGPPGAQRQ